MKPLILTFFGAILCYVLFFDKEKAQTPDDKVNHTIQIDIDACDHFQISDSVMFYAEDMTKPCRFSKITI